MIKMLPPLARVGIAALMLSSFPLKAVAQVLDDTSEGGNVTLAPRYDQDDCEFAKLQWLDADCHYEFR
jgi:hypothetical protein